MIKTLTIKEACRITGLSRPTFLHRIREMGLPRESGHNNTGHHQWLYSREDALKTMEWKGKYQTNEVVSVTAFARSIGIPNYGVLEKYIMGEDVPAIHIMEEEGRKKKKRLVMKRSEIEEWKKGRVCETN